MTDGPTIAGVAALIGDPARANMLTALMDGRALTVSELSQVAGVSLPTTSGHLAKLMEGGLLAAERQGRHRYVRIASAAPVTSSGIGKMEERIAHNAAFGCRDALTEPKRPAYRQTAKPTR